MLILRGRALDGSGWVRPPFPTKLRMLKIMSWAVRLWGLSSMVKRETAQTII